MFSILGAIERRLDPWLAARSISPGFDSTRRLIRGARRPILGIDVTQGSPITPANGTLNANSTILTGVSTSGVGATYQVLATDTNNTPGLPFEVIGGILLNNRITGLTDTYAGARRGAHGQGIRFGTYASKFDILLTNFTAIKMCVYTTDVLTGVRTRAFPDDFTPTAGGTHFALFDLGSRALRVIEVYYEVGGTYVGAINVPPTDSIWRVPLPDQPRIGVVWDSNGDSIMSRATGDVAPANSARLTSVDWLAALFGAHDVWSASRAATGMIADNGGANTTYLQRVADLSVANAGPLDLLVIPFSENDNAQTDAALTAAAISTFQLARSVQPNAVIASCGPKWSNTSQPAQARFDVCRAAFEAALPSDPLAYFLDNGPSAGRWLFGSSSTGINATMLGADNQHLSRAGCPYWAQRFRSGLVTSILARNPSF